MALIHKLRGLLGLGRAVLVGLSEEAAGDDPLALFSRWFDDAAATGMQLPEAVTLATATAAGRPSARLVLLKSFDERGFVFYTNYESRKAVELEANPVAALVFHWSALQRQLRIEGSVSRISEEESRRYFSSRPRGSRIGAWASKQSAAVEKRDDLDRVFREYERRFAGKNIPLPPFWGGYRLSPDLIEFWQGRANRLHDRLCYRRSGEGWTRTRLSP